MTLQVRIQDVNEMHIEIPWSTGVEHLDSQADSWLYRIPHPEDHGLAEYIITPISQLTWQDVWVITIVTVESPGILGRVAKFLGDLGINIVAMNGCTIEQWRYHSIRLIVDCACYGSGVDRDHEYRRSHPEAALNHLKRVLAVEFILDVAPPPFPSVSIERCLTFWSLHQECLQAHAVYPGRRLSVRCGKVEFPESEIRRLVAAAGAAGRNSLKILVNADQSASLVRLFPFRINSGRVSLSLSVANRPGAIAAVTSALGEGGFNILASKAWTSGDSERTSLWLLLQNLGSRFSSVTDVEVVQDVSSLLTSLSSLESFELAVDNHS